MKFTVLLFLPLAFAKLLPGNRVEKEKALTYNAVLVNKDIQEADVVPGIPPTITVRNVSANVNKVERRDKIIQQLLQSESDVICLQEV
ncbi:hypothetical protein MAR_036156 [Mya arenaria]|uniref:Endonuclease/exonuclease/phosphatase domain-containing protein n=1 Tax=Mya arenaria TaxID=6604 RepID=A0ABY7EPB8_MYAAR|nr:hypothetical protein MAR_036156 [Mya arenaria]